jgi:hypothetical protein
MNQISDREFGPGWWVCARGHASFHAAEPAESQPSGAPTHCFVEDEHGEPCLDSSHLWGPFADEAAAAETVAWAKRRGPNAF